MLRPDEDLHYRLNRYADRRRLPRAVACYDLLNLGLTLDQLAQEHMTTPGPTQDWLRSLYHLARVLP